MKRAVCVGINNYPGTGSDLSGCVNDAQDWAAVLAAHDYAVTELLDQNATLRNIVEALGAAIAASTAGDRVVFTFSGHGSWLPDLDGDEVDGRDEMLCPYDVFEGQYLMDDQLDAVFRAKPPGVEVIFISDSCHSGTVSRFALAAPQERNTKVRYLPPRNFLKKDDPIYSEARVVAALDTPPRKLLPKYPALLLAGCKDTEYSYDAWFGDRPNGAFTREAIDALAKNPADFVVWKNAIRRTLPSRSYPQTPVLYGGNKDKRLPVW